MSNSVCTECNGYGWMRVKSPIDSNSSTGTGTNKVKIECYTCSGKGMIETVEGIQPEDIQMLRDAATFIDGYIVGKGSTTIGPPHVAALQHIFNCLSSEDDNDD